MKDDIRRAGSVKLALSALLFGLSVTACNGVTTNRTPVPSMSPLASLAALPSATLTATRAPATASPKPSPSPFFTAPASNQPALVPILMYHHINDLAASASELDLTWTVPPKNFQFQMEWLAQHEFQTITMAQLNAHLKDHAPLPARPIAITFDDGWSEGYSVAFPVLKKYNFVGVYFAYTQPLDRSPLYLSWRQIEEMSASGMSFEAHTLTHPHLRELSADTMMNEIAGSKKVLETRLNKPVDSFAYPFGEYNNAVIDTVKRAGFSSALTIDPGYHQRTDRIYQLQRIRISYNDTIKDFAAKLPPWQ
jgi:peptidoglycan/xylan/chitin deacetylase (PgdA/CDA1 family)